MIKTLYFQGNTCETNNTETGRVSTTGPVNTHHQHRRTSIHIEHSKLIKFNYFDRLKLKLGHLCISQKSLKESQRNELLFKIGQKEYQTHLNSGMLLQTI